MSTKIYNGWKLDVHNLIDIRERMKLAAVAMQRKKEQFVIKEVSHLFHWNLEKRLVGLEEGETDPNKVYSDTVWEFEKECKKAAMEPYHSIYDYKAEVGIIPVSSRTTLAMTFFNRSDYDKVWKRFNWVEDYHYQDQCDKPDKISQAEWTRRKNMWEKAIGPSYVPADHCFNFQLCDSGVFMIFIGGKAKKKVGKPEKCLRDRLTRLVWDKAVKERKTDDIKEISQIMAHRRETKKWLEEKRDGKRYFQSTMRDFISKTQDRYL